MLLLLSFLVALYIVVPALVAFGETSFFVSRYNAVPNTGSPSQYKQLGVWGYFTDADGRENNYVPEVGDEVGAFWNNGETDILIGVVTINAAMVGENAYSTLCLFGSDPEHPDGLSYGLTIGGTAVLRIYRQAFDFVYEAYPALILSSELLFYQHDLAVPIARHTLSYSAGLGGTIDGDSPQMVDQGGTGSLVAAEPDEGYAFTHWSDGVLTATRQDTKVTNDISVTAHFELNPLQVDFLVSDIQLERDVIVWGDGPPADEDGVTYRSDRTAREAVSTSGFYTDHRLYKDTVFTATVTVSNRGCNAADAGTLTVWVNMATQMACGASGDSSQAVGSLAGGQSLQLVFSGLDVGTSVGVRTFRAFVDSACVETEDYDDNNQATKDYRVIDPVDQYFVAQAHTNRMVLLWNDPFYTGISNSWVMVRWSDTAYPSGVADGTLLYSGTNTQCTHSGVSSDHTYYYRFWVSQNGIDWIDPVSGTNLASGYPHLVPAQLILRSSESFTSGSKIKTDGRILLFAEDYSGTLQTNEQPNAFSLPTKWVMEGCGDFNPATPGDELLIRDANGSLYLLYFDDAGNLYWNNIDTNDVCWTSYTAGPSYATNASDWAVDGIGDINGDGMDELILRGTTTFEEGGKTKSFVRILFFDDKGTGTLKDTQPALFKLATRWTIEGVGRFNTSAINSSSDSAQILLQHNVDGGFYLLYLNDDGTMYWNADDTNDVCWTSWTSGNAFSTNASGWRVDAIGDVNGDHQDEIIVSSIDTFEQGGKTKAHCLALFFTDNGTGQLRAQQPDMFSLANLWTIEGMGNFNPTNINSSICSEQLLLRQTANAALYLLYFDDNGQLFWDADDTNSICWTSFTLGAAYATNASSWTIQGIGDVTGSRD